jgi:hypothetical protein
MKKTIRSVAVAGILFGMMTSFALAAEALLAKVTNNHDALNGRLYLVLDEDGSATGMRLLDIANNSSNYFSVDLLAKKEGVILKKQGPKYDVIVLRSNDFEVDRGGHFTLDMLYNGATGKRFTSPLKVDFDGTKWKLLSQGSVITEMNFIVKKVAFLGVVGIKEVNFK